MQATPALVNKVHGITASPQIGLAVSPAHLVLYRVQEGPPLGPPYLGPPHLGGASGGNGAVAE